jgi:trigger factor
MKANLETLDGLNRRLTFNLDAAAIETEVSKRLAKVARTVRIDGFRPGKAPQKLIAARYSPEIRSEVVSEVVNREFGMALKANNLQIAGNPTFTANEEGAIIAAFEVLPEITLGDLSQIKVTRPVVDVSDSDIDRTLNVLCKQRVQFNAVEREAKEGDRVYIDFTGMVDGASFPGGEGKDFAVIIGEGRTLKEFENSLIGLKPGDSKTFDVTFPDDYFAAELAGKVASFTTTLKSLDEVVLPAIDATFAQSLGIADGSVDRLREEIRVNLTRETNRRTQAKVKEQVFNGLIETTQIEVPSGLVAQECGALMEKAVADLKARGMKESDIKLTDSIFEPQAVRRVSLGLIIDKIIVQHGIKASEDQVREMVDEYAQSYEDPANVVKWYYQDSTRLNEARALVLESNIVNWLLEHADISDEVTTVEALMGNS